MTCPNCSSLLKFSDFSIIGPLGIYTVEICLNCGFKRRINLWEIVKERGGMLIKKLNRGNK